MQGAVVQLSWRGIESLCAWEERKGVLHAFMPAEPARWGASVTSPALASRRGAHALRLHAMHARGHERQSSDTVECGTAAHLNLIKMMIIDVLHGPVRIDPVGAARAHVLGLIERHPSPSSRGASVSIFSAPPHCSSSRPNVWNGSNSLVFSVRRAVVPDITAATQAPIEARQAPLRFIRRRTHRASVSSGCSASAQS